ncbi:MAG TPA: hypothetical protein VFQ00_01695 [Terriglobales bacterium]|nr:hypothetical protein [Terriglobales bacterium]
MSSQSNREAEYLDTLFQLTLNPTQADGACALVASLSAAEREEFLSLAGSHHVIVRGLEAVLQHSARERNSDITAWAAEKLDNEQKRISTALVYLQAICEELENANCPTTVMKSLDHYPDLGNDLDLYTTADEKSVCDVMTGKLNAHIEPRSWGDRLANKWNFAVPGLKESVEIHVQRLGQTGEHTALARRFVSRRVMKVVEEKTYYVPAPEERIVVATLQRMYRHFYFRVCDIVNSAAIVESGTLDFEELKRATEAAGIWPGVATYLAIVSDHVKRYRGIPLNLPAFVLAAARFGGNEIKPRARFLRVPVMPHGAALYTHQVTQTAFHGDVPGTLRLSLLPYLASAAAVAYRVTGSDKGVW